MDPVNLPEVEKKLSEGKEVTKEEAVAFLKEDSQPAEGYQNINKPDPEDKEVNKDGEKAETTPAPAEKKAEENKAEDVFVRLERELQKPEGKEDLVNFSPREQAYFFQMKRDRKAKQQAEADRDAALFRESKLKEKKEELPPVKKEEDDPIEALKKRDPTDFLTAKEVLAIAERLKVNAEAAVKPKEENRAPIQDPMQSRFLKMCDDEARSNHPEDYDAVMELTPEIIQTNKDYVVQAAKAIANGENPAEKIYELIKADPEFAKLFPVAQTKVEARKAAKKPEEKNPPAKSAEQIEKERKAKAAQDALELNKDKAKTTGHLGSSPEKSETEITMEEIGQMSDREFAKLPKKIRQEYLTKFG